MRANFQDKDIPEQRKRHIITLGSDSTEMKVEDQKIDKNVRFWIYTNNE